MCGRTAMTASPEELRALFALEETPSVEPHYNVPPSQGVHVVRAGAAGGGRTLASLRWGLVPWWAKDPRIGHRLALARSETAATTPAFRDALRSRRCLVAVSAFYEWRRTTKPSRPFLLTRPDGRPFALAGVWDRWVSVDGEVVESCAILTQPALPPVAAVHDRMPLVLPPEAWSAWLDPATAGDDLTSLLAPRAPDLTAREVTSYVNDPRHDDPRCLEPAPAADTPSPEQLSLPLR